MPFLLDNFTGTDGTIIASHTADDGSTWTANTGANQNGKIASNRMYADAGGIAIYYSSVVPVSPDYDVTGVVRQVSATNNFANTGVRGRLSVGADTCYDLTLGLNSPNIQAFFRKFVAGSATQLFGPTTVTAGNGTDTTLRLSMRGSKISAYVNGALLASVTDTGITAAGRPGIYSALTTSTTDFHLDSVRADGIRAPVRRVSRTAIAGPTGNAVYS